MELEKKPWWVSDQEKQGLSTVPTNDPTKTKEFGSELGKEVQSAVPHLKTMFLSHLVCEFGEKDGLLNFHLYHPVRREIRLQAEEDMDAVRQSDMTGGDKEKRQQEIAAAANELMSKNLWDRDILDKANKAFNSVFKFSEHKVSYFPEVDSVSVVMPVPAKGLVTQQLLEEPLALLNQMLGG